MAFSFGNTSGTPGQTATPFATGTGSGTSFGTSGGLFGSQNTTAFGSSTPGQVPAFGAASRPGMFGAASTPSLFGGAPSPSSGGGGFTFTPSSTHSFLNPPSAPSGIGGAYQNQAQVQQQLLTRENRPISLSTNWDDLSPQAQQYLLDLEKIVTTYAHECKQLEDQDQLVSGDDATTDINHQAKIISQNISALSIRESFDSSEAENLRKAAVHLVRHTEDAVYSFRRATMWRNMTRTNATSTSNHVEDLGPPMTLPYPFLEETLKEFKGRLQAQLSAVYELEVTMKEKNRSKSSTPDTSLAALQTAIANLHDCVMKVAAMIQEMDDKVGTLKAKVLKGIHGKGLIQDPFRKAARDEHSFRTGEQSKVMNAFDEYTRIRGEPVGIPAEPPLQIATGIFNATPQQTRPLFG